MSQVRLSMGCSHIPNHSVHVGGSRCRCEAAASAITAQGSVLTPKKCSTRSVASPQNRQVCGVSTGAKERIRIAVVQAFSHIFFLFFRQNLFEGVEGEAARSPRPAAGPRVEAQRV
jgi:hypothetical protein